MVFNMIEMAIHGVCVNCTSWCATICEVCGDYYCSIQCQQEDWLAHRLICFPLPKLVPQSSIFIPTSINMIEPREDQNAQNDEDIADNKPNDMQNTAGGNKKQIERLENLNGQDTPQRQINFEHDGEERNEIGKDNAAMSIDGQGTAAGGGKENTERQGKIEDRQIRRKRDFATDDDGMCWI